MAVPGVETSDETLAARAAAGDEPAFEALVIRYQARVFRLARRLTGNDGDAQDALQDAFLQVHRHLPSFRGESRFSTWLYRIATNAALMLRRARGAAARGVPGGVPAAFRRRRPPRRHAGRAPVASATRKS